MEKPTEFAYFQGMKASALEAMRHALVGPLPGVTARRAAEVMFDAIIAGAIPGIRANFVEYPASPKSPRPA